MIIRVVLSLLILCLAGFAGYYLYDQQEPTCSVCLRTMHKVTTCRLTMQDGEVLEVCCPRCGLYLEQVRDDIVKKEVADFNSGAFLKAESAYYIEGSSVRLCCSLDDVEKDRSGVSYERTWDRCLPSLVAFRTKEEANRFKAERGGVLRAYSDLPKESAVELDSISGRTTGAIQIGPLQLHGRPLVGDHAQYH